jgi:hypothetical protein
MSDTSYDTPLFNGRCHFLFERTAGRTPLFLLFFTFWKCIICNCVRRPMSFLHFFLLLLFYLGHLVRILRILYF